MQKTKFNQKESELNDAKTNTNSLNNQIRTLTSMSEELIQERDGLQCKVRSNFCVKKMNLFFKADSLEENLRRNQQELKEITDLLKLKTRREFELRKDAEVFYLYIIRDSRKV